MAKYLMRGRAVSLKRPGADECIVNDDIGSNAGNLIYANGVYRTLKHHDSEVDFDEYDIEEGRLREEDISRINETYDAYIIPLANAFRADYITKLKRFASCIRQLDIPCIIVGVGAQFPYEPDFEEPRPYDEAARDFISAALEKSVCVGVRGEITAHYLSLLGFKEGEEVIPIGCPSMFTFGDYLGCRPIELNENSIVSVNFAKSNKPEVRTWLFNLALGYRNGQVICQRLDELKRVYLGLASPRLNPLPVDELETRCFAEDRVRFYLEAEDWIRAMRLVDISIGGRIHGSIAAMLGGAPTIALPYDSRMRELAEYHKVPHIPEKDFNPSHDLETVIGGLDMQSHVRAHPDRYRVFCDFMQKNGLPLPDSELMSRGIEEKAETTKESAVQSAVIASKEDAISRLSSFYFADMAKRDNRIRAAAKELKAQQARISTQTEELRLQDRVISELVVKSESLETKVQRDAEDLSRLGQELQSARASKHRKGILGLKLS